MLITASRRLPLSAYLDPETIGELHEAHLAEEYEAHVEREEEELERKQSADPTEGR